MAKTLFEILKNTAHAPLGKSTQLLDIQSVTSDSRLVEKGSLFVAVKGTTTDGHAFIGRTIEAGAAAILHENEVEKAAWPNVVFIQTDDSAEALGIAAANFFDNPSKKLKLIGVTGTNGKTTVTTLLHQLFEKMGVKTGLIGTVENRIGSKISPSTHTTPDAVSLQKLLAEMVAEGCEHVFLETSSHAIEQRRIAGCHFSGALFTNLTHDHLDYHGTFAAYLKAKKRLFDDLEKTAFALVNADDRNGAVMLQNCKAQKRTFGLRKMADFKAKILENALTGLHIQLGGEAIHCRLVGEFNASNLAAAFAVSQLLGIEKDVALTALSDLRGAEGRFETLFDQKTGRTGIVDYAHTPDALENVLETIRKSLPKNPQSAIANPQLISVVGCGGDRDKTKRPIMAKMAAQLSDTAILTSDNPRTENAETILDEMENGLDSDLLKRKTLRITDRKQAIKTACQLAKSGDVILVAGKGHEKYQIIGIEKQPFDDLELLKTYLFN